MNKFRIIWLAMVLMSGPALNAAAAVAAEHAHGKGGDGMRAHMEEPRHVLFTNLRMLWEDHIVWTRMYIVSTLAGLEDGGAVADRLLRNQEEIGSAIKPYYGEAAGNKLAALLREHIIVATEVVAAAKSGKAKDLENSQKKWSKNGQEIAEFLSAANPHWPKQQMLDMLAVHLKLTTAEVTSRLKKEWAADIAAYDQGHRHMMMFSDLLFEGIVKQFPDKF